MKGFVIAGTGSGSGKTTISLAILAYLSKLGYNVAPFKVGPDFIDPGHHTAIIGKISRNLDSWMLSKPTNEHIFAKGCFGSRANVDLAGNVISDFNTNSFKIAEEIADIAVVEGVMGLFDGYSGISEEGSTAQMAKWLGLPVLLVIDAKSMARSAAAIVKGFENFDLEVEFAGVLFNRTGSARHYGYLKEAVETYCKIKCLGHLPRMPQIAMPERHLGLVTSDEHKLSPSLISLLVDMVAKNTLIKEMVDNLPDYKKLNKPKIEENIAIANKNNFTPQIQNIRIAVARDRAFCFYYQDNIEALQKYGAEIVEFSPIASKTLPPDIHGIYLGGGYPELYTQELSQNKSLMDEIRHKSFQGMPIYGECGGFMYLCKDISGLDELALSTNEAKPSENLALSVDEVGKPVDKSAQSCKKTITQAQATIAKYPMVGCFPFSAIMSKRMRSLGYRQITLREDTVIGKKGDVLRGHEFHYSYLENEEIYQDLSVNKSDEDEQNQIDKSHLNSQAHLPESLNLFLKTNVSSNAIHLNQQRKQSQTVQRKLNQVYNTAGRDGQNIALYGYQINNTLGSYLHLHFESMKAKSALSFVNACREFFIYGGR